MPAAEAAGIALADGPFLLAAWIAVLAGTTLTVCLWRRDLICTSRARATAPSRFAAVDPSGQRSARRQKRGWFSGALPSMPGGR